MKSVGHICHSVSVILNIMSRHIVAATVPGALAATVKSAVAAVLLVALSACETTPGPAGPVTPPVTGGSAAAAELMSRATTAGPEDAAGLYLDAGWAYLDGELDAELDGELDGELDTELSAELDAALDAQPDAADLQGALSAYDSIEPGWLDPTRLPEYHLLAARIALIRLDPELARRAFDQVPESMLETPRALLVASALCAADGDYDCALETLVRGAADDPRHNERIWTYLNRTASMATLNDPTHSDDETLASWRALHRLTVEGISLEEIQVQVSDWLRRHPEHPAAIGPPVAVADFAAYQPLGRHVALLLPLSGPLIRAGEAVRDGFIAAALIAGTSDEFNLSVYDSAAEPIGSLYERVLADGADLIVGPLEKDAVASVNTLNPDLPTLVLNYLEADTIAAENLYQFGLAIEDEAATIAVRLEADGISNPLLFHNYNDWSLRARRALVDAWPHQVTIQPFTDMRTITESVGAAMHVSQSRDRKDRLATVLGHEPEFLPRARSDVDGVVALVDNVEANALVPALRFHFADHLPVYASSQVARRSRAGQLTELGGFRVSELPWFLEDNALYAQMKVPFALDTNPFASLVALGSDAFRIAQRSQLSQSFRSFQMLGSTGLLRLEESGGISRELAWGRIVGARVIAESGTGH